MKETEDYPDKDVPVEAWCDLHELHVRLKDGRTVTNPLWWYPRLLSADPAQRNDIEYGIAGLHWPQIDEDVSIEGMITGYKAPDAVEPQDAAA